MLRAMSDPQTPPASPRSPDGKPSPRRRVLPVVFVILFSSAMGVRVWLHRSAKADRERMMSSLVEHSREMDRERGQRMMEEANRRNREELAQVTAKMEEIQRSLAQPPAPSAAPPSPPPAPSRTSAVEFPHSLVVTHSDLARSTVDLAPATDVLDRAAQKELVSLFSAVNRELATMLGRSERFPDYARVAALLARVEPACPRAEAMMKPGKWKKMVVEAVTELRDDLRDFAAAQAAARDGGAAGAGRP